VWLLENANGTGATSSWTQTLPTGTPPLPGWCSNTIIYDPASNRMIVFGGDPGATTTLFNDVWVLTDAVGPPLVGATLGVDVHGSGGHSLAHVICRTWLPRPRSSEYAYTLITD
jgi:hypothetical protein